MIDLRALRADPHAFDLALTRRGQEPMAEMLLALDRDRRNAIERYEGLQASRRSTARQANEARKADNKKEFERLRELSGETRQKLSELQEEVRVAEERLRAELETVPNPPQIDVPDGAGPVDNVEFRRFGKTESPSFAVREHYEIGESLGLMDFQAATKLSGSRFVVLRGAIARLHQALGRFMLDTHVAQNGYEEFWVPSVVLPEIPYGTGQLPKFAEDLYVTTRGHWLIPTAEVPLSNLAREQILEAESLPMRLVAWTPCFRAEAGAAGQDTRGMLRQHQFEKVELVSIVAPETSEAELERMTRCAEGILIELGLPYRVVTLCTGDMGFAARKTYDIEVWLPGQNRYREISSCSDCGDFQARRMNSRYRSKSGSRPEFVHTLNGSGLAIGRTLIAVMENGQRADGGIDLPVPLAPYMHGARRIDSAGKLVAGD